MTYHNVLRLEAYFFPKKPNILSIWEVCHLQIPRKIFFLYWFSCDKTYEGSAQKTLVFSPLALFYRSFSWTRQHFFVDIESLKSVSDWSQMQTCNKVPSQYQFWLKKCYHKEYLGHIGRNVSTGATSATGATSVTPKFSGTLTLNQMGQIMLTIGTVAPTFSLWLRPWQVNSF